LEKWAASRERFVRLSGDGLSSLQKKDPKRFLSGETLFPNNMVKKVNRFSRHTDAKEKRDA
jgi:hypothetical protein